MRLLSESRPCMACGFERIPDVRIIKKARKHWAIFTCRMCKAKDIEEYTPRKLWNGWKFADEAVPEEDFDD